MTLRLLAPLAAALVATAATSAPTPPAAASRPVLPIAGAFVRDGAALDASAWRRLPHVMVRATDRAGATHAYGGVRLADAVHDAGAPIGDGIRGPAARAYVLVGASDGYAALFSLAELAPADARCAPLVADDVDGSPIPAADGPVRMVVPCDVDHARWVRNVTQLTIAIVQP